MEGIEWILFELNEMDSDMISKQPIFQTDGQNLFQIQRIEAIKNISEWVTKF